MNFLRASLSPIFLHFVARILAPDPVAKALLPFTLYAALKGVLPLSTVLALALLLTFLFFYVRSLLRGLNGPSSTIS